jgi:two-component system alkaline phosphatase synthesis response regulator PhoP
MGNPLILFAENDSRYLDLLTLNLSASGYSTLTARTGAEALRLAANTGAALVILELELPDMSGYDLIRALRADTPTAITPIIVLTGLDTDEAIVRAFDLGADDYIIKPFGMREFIARVRAVLRRYLGAPASDVIRVGPITIDSDNYEAFRNGEKIILTLKEYELLKLLASSPGKVLTRDFLLDRIWGYEFYGETRTVDVHIRHIRQKLGADAGMIETVRGVGYKMRATA